MCGILKDLGSFIQKIRALNFVYGSEVALIELLDGLKKIVF